MRTPATVGLCCLLLIGQVAQTGGGQHRSEGQAGIQEQGIGDHGSAIHDCAA